MTNNKPTYAELNHELSEILASLQQTDIDIDLAVSLYQRGLEIIKKLETQLQTATNSVQELKATFDKKSE